MVRMFVHLLFARRVSVQGLHRQRFCTFWRDQRGRCASRQLVKHVRSHAVWVGALIGPRGSNGRGCTKLYSTRATLVEYTFPPKATPCD